MGTRADFYVGRGEKAEWLGSVAWDGYPGGFDKTLFEITTETGFREAIGKELSGRGDGTLPEMGWPWPWPDSQTTDYSYAFDEGKVWASCFGYGWQEASIFDNDLINDEGPKVKFPNMKDTQNVTLGPRSGVMVFGAKPE